MRRKRGEREDRVRFAHPATPGCAPGRRVVQGAPASPHGYPRRSGPEPRRPIGRVTAATPARRAPRLRRDPLLGLPAPPGRIDIPLVSGRSSNATTPPELRRRRCDAEATVAGEVVWADLRRVAPALGQRPPIGLAGRCGIASPTRAVVGPGAGRVLGPEAGLALGDFRRIPPAGEAHRSRLVDPGEKRPIAELALRGDSRAVGQVSGSGWISGGFGGARGLRRPYGPPVRADPSRDTQLLTGVGCACRGRRGPCALPGLTEARRGGRGTSGDLAPAREPKIGRNDGWEPHGEVMPRDADR